MSFKDISELPVINFRGNNFRRGEQDAGGILHLNVVRQYVKDAVDQQLLFWAGEDDHPGNGGVKRVFRGKLHPDGFDDETNEGRAEFDGYRIVEEPVNQSVATFIDYPFPFDVDTTTPARLSDFSVVDYMNGTQPELRLFCIVNNHQTTGRNHMGMLISQDAGLSWTFGGEVFAPNGTSNQGTPFGMLVNIDNVLYTHAGDGSGGKRDRYSLDGGVTWVDTGMNLPISSDPFDLNHTAMPIGRGRVIGDKLVCFMNNSQRFQDWPKTISAYYKDLGTKRPNGTYSGLTSGAWQKHPFPVSVAAPTSGGEWQMNVVDVHGQMYGLVNRWGEVGFDLINTPDMDALQDTPYYGINGTPDHPNGFGHKHVYCKKLAWDGLFDNLGTAPVTDGGVYTLEYGNKYLGITNSTGIRFGEQLRMHTGNSDDRVKWRFTFHHDTLQISPVLAPALGLSVPGFATTDDANARGVSIDLRTLVDGDIRTRWVPLWVGGRTPSGVTLVNLKSRLELKPDGKQDVSLNEQSAVWRLRKVS